MLAYEAEKPQCNGGPLYCKGGQHHVESDTTEGVATKERHQETEPDEYHDMHILEDCNKRTRKQTMNGTC